MTYMGNYTIPGTDLVIVADFMVDPDSQRFALDWVRQRCPDKVKIVAVEMARRMKQRHSTIRVFLSEFRINQNVDTAIAEALKEMAQ